MRRLRWLAAVPALALAALLAAAVAACRTAAEALLDVDVEEE